MKIIGSKDYYDYLIGVYGIDDAVVLDRREGVKVAQLLPDNGRSVHPISIAFCGTLYRGAINAKSKQGWWRYDVEKFCDQSNSKKSGGKQRFDPGSGYCMYYGVDSNGSDYIEHIPNSTEYTKLNNLLECPVIALLQEKDIYGTRYAEEENWGVMAKYPLELAHYGFANVVEPDAAYKTIYSWLIERKNEPDTKVLDDKDKVVSKGFDKRISFRHRK